MSRNVCFQKVEPFQVGQLYEKWAKGESEEVLVIFRC